MKIIKTSDFYLAAYLLALDILLQDTFMEGKRMVFYFEESEETKEAISNFYRTLGLVEPKAYSDAIRNLKSFIHSNIKDEDEYQNEQQTITDKLSR